jgi:hypothetical protein
MSAEAAQVWRALNSGVRPGVPERAPPAAALTESFQELLARAAAGQLNTGAPVRVAPDSGLTLTEGQLARLSVAADQAEARGVAKAAVLMDGAVFTLDVAVRTVTGTLDPSKPGVHAGLDAVIAAPAPPVSPADAGAPALLRALCARMPPGSTTVAG